MVNGASFWFLARRDFLYRAGCYKKTPDVIIEGPERLLRRPRSDRFLPIGSWNTKREDLRLTLEQVAGTLVSEMARRPHKRARRARKHARRRFRREQLLPSTVKPESDEGGAFEGPLVNGEGEDPNPIPDRIWEVAATVEALEAHASKRERRRRTLWRWVLALLVLACLGLVFFS